MSLLSVARQGGFDRFTFGALIFAVFCFTWIAFKQIEPVVFPVVKDFKITESQKAGDSVYISGSFRKVRQCRFKGLVAYDGTQLVTVEFLGNPSTTTNRLTRFQKFGPWKLTPPVTHLQLSSYHECWSGEVITTVFAGNVQ